MENQNVRYRKFSISSDVRFYTKMTVQKLFNDPRFPSTDFGRNKVVEAHALIEYFATRHEKDRERHWR